MYIGETNPIKNSPDNAQNAAVPNGANPYTFAPLHATSNTTADSHEAVFIILAIRFFITYGTKTFMTNNREINTYLLLYIAGNAIGTVFYLLLRFASVYKLIFRGR